MKILNTFCSEVKMLHWFIQKLIIITCQQKSMLIYYIKSFQSGLTQVAQAMARLYRAIACATCVSPD